MRARASSLADEDAALRGLHHEVRVRLVEERNDRARRLVDDLLDQLERMLRARSETDERDIRLFARRDRADFADLDLRCDHLVSEAADDVGDDDQAVMSSFATRTRRRFTSGARVGRHSRRLARAGGSRGVLPRLPWLSLAV